MTLHCKLPIRYEFVFFVLAILMLPAELLQHEIVEGCLGTNRWEEVCSLPYLINQVLQEVHILVCFAADSKETKHPWLKTCMPDTR